MASKILSIDLQGDLLTAALLADDINKDIIDSAAIVTAGKTAGELIAELTAALDCSDCRCFLSLGASFFSFRNLHLPFSEHKAIHKILPFELEESSAASIDSMLIDAMIYDGEGEGSEVICAMIKRETLGEYHRALNNAGLAPEFITLSGLATIAAIQANGHPPDEFLFLDLRLGDASLFLISAGRLQLVRSLAFNPLSADPEAESVKLQVKVLDQSEAPVNKLARAVKQTLAPLPLPIPQEQFPIYVDNSAASEAILSPLLEAPDAFNRPCLTCGRGGLLPSPFGLPEKTEKQISVLTACISLGLQGDALKGHAFNFCKEEFSVRRKLREYRHLGKLLALPLACLLLVGLATLWYQIQSLKRQQATLVTEINEVFTDTLPGVTRIVDPVQQLQVAVDDTQLSSTDDGGNPILPYTVRHILREISLRIPQSLDVRLTRLIYESKGLRIIGLTDSFNTVDSMKKTLQQSPDFGAVTISSTKQAPRDNKIRFELRIDMREGTP